MARRLRRPANRPARAVLSFARLSATPRRFMSDHPAASAPPASIPHSESRPFVRDVGDRRSLHFSEQVIQSSMSLLNPDALELEYTRMMMGFLLFNPEPDRIVMVGLGGGSLAKFCHRHLPRSQVEALEINPAVAAARRFHGAAGRRTFPRHRPRRGRIPGGASDHADVILLDGFGDQGMPDALCSEAFYADCLRALRDDGLLVINFHVNHPLYHEYLAACASPSARRCSRWWTTT